MATSASQHGTVTRTTRTIHEIVVHTDPLHPADIRGDDEIVLTVNGKVVKRYKLWQAERAGLVMPAQEGQYN